MIKLKHRLLRMLGVAGPSAANPLPAAAADGCLFICCAEADDLDPIEWAAAGENGC